MTDILGPEWAVRGLDQRAGRYPLSVEGPVLRAVEALVPGVSTVTRFVRYYAFYAALAAHAAARDLDADACRRLLRRSEVVLAAAHRDIPWETPPGAAHGIDGVGAFCDDHLRVAEAAETERGKPSYSPRRWGFWEQYRGPSVVLGTVELEGDALRPGRHHCPAEVRDLFAPVFAYAERDRVPVEELAALDAVTLPARSQPEREWMVGLFTATREGHHDPDEWEADDRTRRATLRVLTRSVQLYGDRCSSFEEVMRSAVAFGHHLEDDPVLAGMQQSQGWRGVILRHFSVNAWRRLWAALVRSIGGEDGAADRTREELRGWIAERLPDMTVGRLVQELTPLQDKSGQPLPVERQLLAAHDRADPYTNVRLLLTGALRCRQLDGVARQTFFGPRPRGRGQVLDPEWVRRLAEDYRDRSVQEFGGRLVDDMLAQATRVARAKMRMDPTSHRLLVPSRIHERNDRFFKSSDEGDGDIGLRIHQLGDFAVQMGLIKSVNGTWTVPSTTGALLELV